MVARKVESKNMKMAIRRITPNTSIERNLASANTPQPTRLTPQQLEERREKGLCFNCDRKYSKENNYGEKKLFYIDYEGEEGDYKEPSQAEEEHETTTEKITPTISWHALDGICTSQTLKIEGYIKKRKVIVLIDCGSTHNFIHCKLAKALNYFTYPAQEPEVMISNGGTINYSRKCHKITLTMGEYVLNSLILSIPMGVVGVVLGVQWLQ